MPIDKREVTNARRAAWAGQAIELYREITGTDREDMLSDFLGDLRHWAAANNFDYEAADWRGTAHYETEVREDR